MAPLVPQLWYLCDLSLSGKCMCTSMPDHCQKYPESPLAKVKLVTFDFDETLSLDEFEGMGRWKWPETISHLHCYKVLQMMVLISDVVSNLAWACKCSRWPIVFIIFTHAIHARSFTFVLLFGKTKMVLVIETISYIPSMHITLLTLGWIWFVICHLQQPEQTVLSVLSPACENAKDI